MIFFQSRNQKRILTMVFIAVFSLVAVFSPLGAYAQNPFNYGGLVVFSFLCNCSGNYLLFVTPPKSGFFSYYNTPQFANYMLPSPSVWTLGLYSPVGICLIYVGKACKQFIKPKGTILPTVGTSF